MEALVKIHKKKPIEVPLPGNQILEVFVQDYITEGSEPIEQICRITCFYYSSNRLNYLTERIINGYIHRHLKTHLKLFSIEGSILSTIKVR